MGFYKNDKGAAFIVVIITMAVLLILGTTAASIASSNFIMGHAERRYLSAYYVAEAGIRHQIEHMRLRMEDLNANTANASAFFTTFNNPQHITAPPLILRNQGNDVVRADISMILPHQATGNTTAYTFDSIGRVGNTRRTLRGSVTLEWAMMTPPPVFFERALFSAGSPDISNNATIVGGVSTNASSIDDSARLDITGGIFLNANIIMPGILAPALPERGNLNVGGTTTINANGRYNNLTVGGTLRFDLSAGDLLIRASTLTMNSGRIETFGSGRLYLFIDGDVDLTGNDLINPGLGRANHMVMIALGSNIDARGNSEFFGGLYAPRASLRARGGAQFTGAIMVGSADLSGNPDIIYLPIPSIGIEQFFTSTPGGYVPPERMFIVTPWIEP